jgi:hypothetical protein
LQQVLLLLLQQQQHFTSVFSSWLWEAAFNKRCTHRCHSSGGCFGAAAILNVAQIFWTWPHHQV